ncbi:MAG: hypothetical protein M3416_06965 [Acidobacteriota bacterium]|nr:hypothetical protein [Acidobacteriota bacterium]
MATKKGEAKKSSGGKKQARGTGPRELLKPGKKSYYGRRGKKGRFTEMDEVGPSLRADRRQRAKTEVRPGYGDQGDQPRRKSAGKKPGAKKAARKGGAKKGPSSKKR